MTAVEICVIFAQPTYYLEEQVQALKNLEDADFKVLYVPDEGLSADWLGKLDLDGRFRVVPSGRASIPFKRNFCVKNIRPDTEWIAFMDDDAFPPPGWLGALKERILKNPRVKIFGAPSLPPPRASARERAVGLVTQSYLGLGAQARWHRPLKEPVEVRELPSSNLVVRKSCFESDGSLFDERLAIGEDVEWCQRMRKKFGEPIWMFPEPYLYHHSRPLFRPAFFQFFRYGSYRMRIFLSQKDKTVFETVSVLLPAIFPALPFLALGFFPAALLLISYMICIIMEGLKDKKSPMEHALRLFSVPTVHFSYGLGLLARLVRLPCGNTQTYVRVETLRDLPEAE
jgi:GT2 family glycosyltransferase